MSALALVLLLAAGQTEPTEPIVLDLPQPDRLVVGVDYLYWFIRNTAVPPLATSGPPGSTAVLGQPGTTVVYGDDRLTSRHDDRYIGVRFGGDWRLGDDRTFAVH